jgi:hypothetical protein
MPLPLQSIVGNMLSGDVDTADTRPGSEEDPELEVRIQKKPLRQLVTKSGTSLFNHCRRRRVLLSNSGPA